MFFMTENHIPEGVGFQTFDLTHILWLLAGFALWIGGCIFFKKLSADKQKRALKVLGSIIFTQEIIRDLALLILCIIYLVFRRYGVSWFGAGGLKAAGNFMLIFAVWGVFQLLICAVIVLQDTNTLIPFHPVKNPAVVEKK